MRNNLVAIILAGGKGTRLNSLTDDQPKPLISFAGNYKIIDFVLSNCFNSGIKKIGITTQYKQNSVIKYLGDGAPWGYDKEGVFSILPAYQNDEKIWYLGTANSVLQNIDFINNSSTDYVLVLPSDHIYQMDYNDLFKFHINIDSDCTLIATYVNKKIANKFGIIEIKSNSQISDFQEKPENPKSNLASMGIYLFKKKILIDVLYRYCGAQGSKDFGADLFSKLVKTHNVFAYKFQNYWKDVGTIDDYWKSNMDFINPPLNINLKKIKTKQYNYSDTIISNSSYIQNSIISKGCIIKGRVSNSVISPGVIIEKNALVKDSVILNNTRIKGNAKIQKSIVAKNINEGQDLKILNINSNLTSSKSLF